MQSSFFVPHPYGVLPRGNAPDDARALLPHRFGESFQRLLTSLPLSQTACEEMMVGRGNADYFSVARNRQLLEGGDGGQCEAKAPQKAGPKKAPAKKVQSSGSSHITGGGNVAQFADEGITMAFLLDLTSFMTIRDLSLLSATCTGWYVFLHANTDVWRRQHLMITDRLLFTQDWKTTTVRLYLGQIAQEMEAAGDSEKSAALLKRAESFYHTVVRPANRFYCDTLFQSWICTNLPSDFGLIKRSAVPRSSATTQEGSVASGSAPSSKATTLWNYRSKFKTVDVVDAADLTEEMFNDQYERKNVPLIIKGGCIEWPLYKLLNGGAAASTNAESSRARTRARCDNLSSLTDSAKMAEMFSRDSGSVNPLQCESFKMTPKEYVQYATQQQDERPTYLFDPEFGETSMDVATMYTVPHVFDRDDYFKLLGEARPKYRWVIAGPSRGGSNFHIDPNFTNAWNACITGRKRWLFFPPHSPPCGVYPSDDMADVTTPETLSEWLLNFYNPTVETMKDVGYECICDAGDIAFVPCGWWHLVINLEDSVAITQNYISRNNLGKVLMFLKFMKKSISGVGEDDCEEFNLTSNSGGEVVSKKASSSMGMMSLESVCSRQSNLRGDLIKALETVAPGALKEALAMESSAEEKRRHRALRRAGVTRSFQRLPLDSSGDEGAEAGVEGAKKRPREDDDAPVRETIQFDNGLDGGFQF